MVNPMLPVTLQGAIVRRRNRRLLGPIDLTLQGAGITVILGPNGAGKTTLLKTLHGLERLSAGTLRWNLPDTEARTRQAYVFQTPVMLRRSVAQNLAYPLSLIGTPRPVIRQEVAQWAKRMGLGDALDRSAMRLSGGERQKLSLGRALIRAPDVLFLDEPCTNLDGRSTREIEALLRSAHACGTRIVMATHDLGQARRLATEVVFLIEGKLNETGRAPDCLDRPETPSLRAFLKGDIIE
jgi:tungstate transport system ATP-binding protein